MIPKMTVSRRGAEDFMAHQSLEGGVKKDYTGTFIGLTSSIKPSTALASWFSDKGLYSEIAALAASRKKQAR